MVREKVLVVGLGDVGRPLYELLKDCTEFSVFGFDIDVAKAREVGSETSGEVDVMHICFPCSSQTDFVRSVAEYAKRFRPTLIIIDSTVPPKTTEKVHEHCGCRVAHSPVRGVHKSPEYMKRELRRWTKYVGGADAESSEMASKHFKKLGLKVKILHSARETELAKLFETTYRAWMIACFQEMHRISRHFEVAFDEIVDFLEDTHLVRLDRPIMFPGVIGGHCLIPNVELLLKAYDSQFLHLILNSNKRRKEEIREEDVKEEVEKIRERTRILERRHLSSRGKASANQSQGDNGNIC